MATGNTNYATLASTTLANFANEIFDNVITNNALANELKKSGNIKVVSGGTSFTHPVYYNKNNTFAAIGKYGTIPTDLQDPLTRAEYGIKVLAGSVVYSLVEEAMNAGDKEKLIDYLETLKMDAESSMSELLGDQLFKAAGATGDDDFDSIPEIIANSASTQTINVGGINSSSSGGTFWRNYAYTTAVTAFNTSSAGLTAFESCVNGATFGRQGPTIGITTKAIFQLYSIGLTANIRYSDTSRADAGFKNLLFATIPIMFDDNVAANYAYFIDTNSLKLQVLSQGNLKITPYVQSYSQLMARALLYLLANLTCGSRRTQAVASSISG